MSAGTVYLLHFHAPGRPEVPMRYKHAGHYLGWTYDLAARLALHERGQGARLLKVARAAGITWQLARTWSGGRARERQLKRQGGASRLCPLCGVTPRTAVFAGVPRNVNGSPSRSRTPDIVLAAIGSMTRAQQAKHTALRKGAARGRVPGLTRLACAPADDPWYTHTPAGAA